MLAGWDLLAGGTWLGLTRSGRLAALTNVRDPSRQRDHPPSRGTLVRDFLLDDCSPQAFCTRALANGQPMLGFNLICGRIGGQPDFVWCSNTSGDMRCMPPGLYGLSNAQLDTPWPKVSRGKARVSALLADLPFGEALLQALDAVLRDTCLAAEDRLPDTGVSKPMEKLLSPMFIRSPEYGTRSTTVILVHRDGRVLFQEVSHMPGEPGHARVALEFSLDR